MEVGLMATGAQLVQEAYDAFGRGDIPTVLGVLAEDVDWNVSEAVPHGGRFEGRDAVGRFFAGLVDRWEDFGIEIDDLVDGGDDVVGVGRAHGNLKGTGEAGYGFAHVFTVRDGSVVRFREYVDPDATLRSV
jgi:ketosteroid isomerase-like protein